MNIAERVLLLDQLPAFTYNIDKLWCKGHKPGCQIKPTHGVASERIKAAMATFMKATPPCEYGANSKRDLYIQALAKCALTAIFALTQLTTLWQEVMLPSLNVHRTVLQHQQNSRRWQMLSRMLVNCLPLHGECCIELL